jgi:hypothetical protein
MGRPPLGSGSGLQANPSIRAVAHCQPGCHSPSAQVDSDSDSTGRPIGGDCDCVAVVGWVGEVVMGNGDGISAERVGVLGGFNVV